MNASESEQSERFSPIACVHCLARACAGPEGWRNLGQERKRTPTVHSRDLARARNSYAGPLRLEGRGSARCDFQAGSLINLYEISHHESTVDNGDKSAENNFELRPRFCYCTADACQRRREAAAKSGFPMCAPGY
jgi:hypothetical protein